MTPWVTVLRMADSIGLVMEVISCKASELYR